MMKIEISHKTIFFIAIFCFTLWIVFQIRDILFLLFIAFILMAGLRPLVDIGERFKIPRGISILLVYILLFGTFGIIGSFLLPPLINESMRFATQLSTSATKIIPQLKIETFYPQLGAIGQNIFFVTIGVFSNVIAIFTLFISTFYLLLERKHLSDFLTTVLGEKSGKKIQSIVITVEERIGAWIRGQLALMVIIGIAVYIGLLLLRIPFVLPLAIIAGILEVVPNVGPIVSAVPALFIAWKTASNPLLVLAVASLYFIIQQLENSIVVPLIMKKAVGLSPLITIISLLIGGRLAGVPGILFAVPFVLIVQTVMQQIWGRK